MKIKYEEIGLLVPEILFPKPGVDLSKWAIVACDQFTSQPEYWQDVSNFVGDSPSTLNIIFPEVYLESEDGTDRIENINNHMNSYVKDNVLEKQEPGFVLVDRKTSQAESRKGLVVALDLELYDYNVGSKTLIRATEGTIIDRLPPRIKIRENSPIELPHIMVLIDDPDKTVIEPLFESNPEVIYDFELMMNSGHIKGYKINKEEQIENIASALIKLADEDAFDVKYNVKDRGVLLYAMGDGNHSLATAKAIWENLKEKAKDRDEVMNSAARYALVELVNVHDPGLEFEPIHRVMFNIDCDNMLVSMNDFYKNNESEFSYNLYNNKEEMYTDFQNSQGLENLHAFCILFQDSFGVVSVKNPVLNLEVGTLQLFLDEYLKAHEDAKIDYIHGEDVVESLSKENKNCGFILPGMSKSDLFKTVIVDGALPRKTFSMGEADEKRFYLECRGITG